MLGFMQLGIDGFGGRLLASFALFAGALTSSAWATEPVLQARQDNGVERQPFFRLSRDVKKEPRSLDTAIVEYSPHKQSQTALQVDLIAAVHVGSEDYYATLNEVFKQYDAVLYELVAPENARVPRPGGRPAGAIGSAQQGMTKLLGLTFQLNQIDYTARNFVHADLSPQEFDQAMAKRGESWWSMFMKLMEESMARAKTQKRSSPDIGVGDLFGIFFGSNRELLLRRLMAEQFSDMDVLTAAFGGEDGSTLITDRNTAALNVLRDQINKGRQKIAVFYGAAHMDDFDQRLRQDFGLQPGDTTWLEAWDLRDVEDGRRR